MVVALTEETEGILQPRSALDVCCAWAAWLLPLMYGLVAASDRPSWDDDLALLRDVGFVSVGTEGLVSTLLCQLAALAPVGGRVLRASCIGIMAAGVCSGLFFGAVRRRLDSERAGRLNPLWALLVSQIWASSAAVQTEAARVGGGSVALMLVLTGVWLQDELSDDARVHALLGGLVALTFAECHGAGLVLLTVCIARWVSGGHCGAGRERVDFAVSLSLTLGVLACLRWVRTLAPRLPLDLGFSNALASRSSESTSLALSSLGSELARSGLEWLGAVPLALSLCGVGWVLFHSSLRRAYVPFGVLALLGFLAPIARTLGFELTARLLMLTSSVALLAFAAVALRALIHGLWQRRVPFARPAAVLGTAFVGTLVLSRIEARDELAATRPVGAEVWTEEAYGRLPTASLVLVDSMPLSLRLLSARLIQGERPDLWLVPTRLLARGSLLGELRRAHPELAPLLRQLAVSGSADEFSLSELADSRRLFVELDANWDTRLLEHLKPEGLWLGLSPHALGGPDRRKGAEESRSALWRVIEPLGRAGSLDSQTRSALSLLAGQQALLLAGFGDRTDAKKMLHIRGRLSESDALGSELSARLGKSERGRVPILDLLD